jgi:hypothetical protein
MIKPYRPQTKSARNALNERDLDDLMENFISASGRADFL